MTASSLLRLCSASACFLASAAVAQQVCLPAPRLLTLMPMGGQAGATVEVSVTGEHIEELSGLLFSAPGITASPALDESGQPVEGKFLVAIEPDAPEGVHDARVVARLGVSSARAFSVGSLPETSRAEPNNSLETALPLELNSICNASMTKRAVDYYTFQASAGQRVAVECAARGIDSKLLPVVIVADAAGRDLAVDRSGGLVDFTAPADGSYVVKVHGLTFQGGPEHFYRLVLREAPAGAPLPRHPSTAAVGTMSWPPPGLPPSAAMAESEPNNSHAEAQRIALPADIEGSFYPAADVDTYEFEAKKGEVWWVEVASERLGLSTDPFVLVQRVIASEDGEILEDVAEINDIPSPVKVSSNGYSYDGPPYHVGSADALGKVEIPEDGLYRLQVRDLLGGTRSDPGNRYRLVARQAQPDFALAAWAVHMTLRNGDRNALSKPVALRAGGAMAFEVLAVRRDGFDGEIHLSMDNLPPGVTASGLKIPAGKSAGHLVISAADDAADGFSLATITGRAEIGGQSVTRPCRVASMAWPVKDAKQEIPSPRLMADVPVSVTSSEQAPLSLAAAEDKVWEAEEGSVLAIPLRAEWRGEFSGSSIKLKAYGAGFEGVKEIDVPVNAGEAELALDLAALKIPPGEHALALYGIAVNKYRHFPEAVAAAEEENAIAETAAAAVAAEAKMLAEAAAGAPEDQKSEAANAAKIAAEKQKEAEAAMARAAARMKSAADAAAPKDIAEIFVSAPIRVAVKPAAESP